MPDKIRKIHKIESIRSLQAQATETQAMKKRVAAYARVSTDSEEQSGSYAAQVEFYTRYITDNPDWEFVSVYADEGMSGTNTRKREGFNRMVADAMDGKIDLILTKSISRFARNTVDTLTTVRKLKEKGIEVYFEKENIRTLDAKGEVMITIMSSLAQEESRSISENVRWGKRRSMEEGRFSLCYKHFLGYEKGEDGLPKIVEREAGIVREIYQRFLDGKNASEIAAFLTNQGIPTPKGKAKWSPATVMGILQNEKYKGDALLQKTYTPDFLTKKQKKNHGEVAQYYIKNSHPAIIAPDTFELVQQEIQRRRPNRRKLYKSSIFATKVVCGDCGSFYGRKVWHSNSEKYRKQVWRCNHKYDAANDTICKTPNLTEDEMKAAFVRAVSLYLAEKPKHIARLEQLIPILSDTKKLEQQAEASKSRHETLLDNLRAFMAENTRIIQDQATYNQKYAEMEAECIAAEKATKLFKHQVLEQLARKEQAHRSLLLLKRLRESPVCFEEELWNGLVDTVTVTRNKQLIFRFRDKAEVTVDLPEKAEEPEE